MMRGDRPLTVVLLLDTRTGQFGGVESYCYDFALALGHAGHQAHVVLAGVPLPLDNPEHRELRTHHVEARALETVPRSEWESLLDRIAPDVVVLAKGWFDRRNPSLDAVIASRGCAYIIWEGHPAPPAPAGRIRRAVRLLRGGWSNYRLRVARQRHWRRASRVLCVSHHVRDLLVSEHGLPSSHADCIYPGIDFARYAFDPALRLAARQGWGVPVDARVVGTLGRLVRHKRTDLLLHAFAKLRQDSTGGSLYCVIVGSGPELEGLRRLAKDLNIEERTRFVGWIEDPRSAYCGFDLFCLPSEDEGLGLVLIEAGACGCIPLAANAGGMPEVLDHLGLDLIVDDWSAESWANRLRAHLSWDADSRAGVQETTRSRLQKRFDAVTQWQRTIDWVEQVVRR